MHNEYDKIVKQKITQGPDGFYRYKLTLCPTNGTISWIPYVEYSDDIYNGNWSPVVDSLPDASETILSELRDIIIDELGNMFRKELKFYIRSFKDES